MTSTNHKANLRVWIFLSVVTACNEKISVATQLATYNAPLVEKEALGKPEKGMRPGSHTNRDQCLELVPVRPASAPWANSPLPI